MHFAIRNVKFYAFSMRNHITSRAIGVALLSAISTAVCAASPFYLVVPIPRSNYQAPTDPIVVSLASAALPKAMLNQAYSHSLLDYLSVTGDPALDKTAARWSLADGTLPAGLALDEATGAVAGTPTTKTTSPASFTVLSAYKGSEGQAIYTIEVGGVVFQASRIVGGGFHTCAITDSGGVKCWGNNTYGQLGDNTTTNRLVPVAVSGLTSGVASIAAGRYHTCAVLTSGAAKCWGYNNNGQLGDNSETNRLTPVNVVGVESDIASMAVGANHTCAVTSSGAAKCWGANSSGQLGDNSTVARSTPVAVVGLDSGVAVLVAEDFHSCALMTSGVVKCWGGNSYGQLGDNSTTARFTPVQVVGLSEGVGRISSGAVHNCVITTDGVVKCWGYNSFGQLGDNTTTQRNTPVTVSGLASGVASLESGSYHTCVVTTLGAAKCWGYNYYGQLGDNSTTNRQVPVDVSGLSSGVANMAGGDYHTCALGTAGGLKCWGYNYAGQVGDNSMTQRLTPVDVQGFQ